MIAMLQIIGVLILLIFAIVGISCTVAFIVGKIYKLFYEEFDPLTFFEDKEKDR